MAIISESALEAVRDRESLFKFLRQELKWPVHEEDTFTYTGPQLNSETNSRVEVSQIIPFSSKDPFVIMLAEFQTKFRRSDLREILRAIKSEMRTRARYEGKGLDQIIFVCPLCEDDCYTGIRFAHFKDQEGRQPRISVFGWDCDQVIETRTLREINLPYLTMPSLNLLDEPDWDQCQNNWRDAWNVEKVTKEFFEDYKRIFRQVGEMISGVTGDKRLFTQRLFNRLLFIQFLQKKKWLRYEGSNDYLKALFQAATVNNENFYSDRLYWLFFHGLGRPNDLASDGSDSQMIIERRGEVPFLNGGLFEQADADDLPGQVKIDNAAFSLVLNDLFGRYNFTVTESTPLDIEVAVDPEMLGKIFEELITGRHETGSYYTPRNVVAFMCKEGLKGYIRSSVPSESSVAIEAFVEIGDATELGNSEAVLDALKKIKLCDPACGSGAYLLGMMQELMRLRADLFTAKSLDPKTLYERKLEIIERNLYGVDKDEFAANVAMLRLWLSLVVDDTRNPLENDEVDVSLPNLRFKIQVGDSLLGPNPDPSLLELNRNAYTEHAHKLHSLHEEYFEPLHKSGNWLKKDIENEILAEQAEIAKLFGTDVIEGVVDWRIVFAEVFASPQATRTMDGRFPFANDVSAQPSFLDIPTGGDGFDLVLANPPYVRADAQFKHIEEPDERCKAIEQWKEYRRLLVKSGSYETLYEKWDLYIPFLERAYQILRTGGQMVFIIADSYNANKYTKKSHDFFLKRSTIERIDFCSDLPLFEAGVSNTIVHFSSIEPGLTHRPLRIRRWGQTKDDFDANFELLDTELQNTLDTAIFKPDKSTVSKDYSWCTPLASICYVSVGMVLNAHETLAPGQFTAKDLIASVRNESHPKKYAEGKDIVRWSIQRTRYLEYGTDRAPALFRRKTFPELYEVPEKLICMDISGGVSRVAYDASQLFHNHSAWSFVPWHYLTGVRNKSIRKSAKYRDEAKPDEGLALYREEMEGLSRQFLPKYILALMNSAFASDWLIEKRRSKMHVYPDDWKEFPVPQITLTEQQEFVDAVDAILEEFAQNRYPLPIDAKQRVAELEAEIDERVSALYGL